MAVAIVGIAGALPIYLLKPDSTPLQLHVHFVVFKKFSATLLALGVSSSPNISPAIEAAKLE